jgi:hypothetical protein
VPHPTKRALSQHADCDAIDALGSSYLVDLAAIWCIWQMTGLSSQSGSYPANLVNLAAIWKLSGQSVSRTHCSLEAPAVMAALRQRGQPPQ